MTFHPHYCKESPPKLLLNFVSAGLDWNRKRPLGHWYFDQSRIGSKLMSQAHFIKSLRCPSNHGFCFSVYNIIFIRGIKPSILPSAEKLLSCHRRGQAPNRGLSCCSENGKTVSLWFCKPCCYIIENAYVHTSVTVISLILDRITFGIWCACVTLGLWYRSVFDSSTSPTIFFISMWL